MKNRVLWRALLGVMVGVLPLMTWAEDGVLGAGRMAERSHAEALWAIQAFGRTGSVPVTSWDLALLYGGIQQPVAMQVVPPRITLATRMRFATRNPNSTGYCANLGFFDESGNLVQMGVRADRTDQRSQGIPRIYSEAIYGIDMGLGTVRGEYGAALAQPDTPYQLELRYLDDQHEAQLWVDGVLQSQMPIQLIGRIYVTLKICARDNGDQITADFEDVTVGGFNPIGNGYNNDVILYGDWTLNEAHGLVMRQTALTPSTRRQHANFHGEGSVAGAQPGSWSEAVAQNAEHWVE